MLGVALSGRNSHNYLRFNSPEDFKPLDAGMRTKPDVGATTLKGTGTGGQIGVTGGTLLTQFVLKNQVRFPSDAPQFPADP